MKGRKLNTAVPFRQTVGTSSKQDLCIVKRCLISNRSDDAATERKGPVTAGAAICHLPSRVTAAPCAAVAHVSKANGKNNLLLTYRLIY